MRKAPKQSVASKSGSKQKPESTPKFIKTLYLILEDKSNSELISWTDDGKAVVIKNPIEFSDSLLPLHFKHRNFSSFVRQLNLYNFRKKKRLPYDHTFSHNMFMKGRDDLLKFVKRKYNRIHPAAEDSSPKEEPWMHNDDVDFVELIDQNICYKKLHQEMNDRVSSLEKTVKGLHFENNKLQQKYSNLKVNETFLKHVIGRITDVYGYRQVREIVKSVSLHISNDSLIPLSSQLKSKSEPIRTLSKDHSFSKGTHHSHRELTRHDIEETLMLKSNLHTISPFMRTASSNSTIPEVNHTNYFHPNYVECDAQELENEISVSKVFTLNPRAFGSDTSLYTRDPSSTNLDQYAGQDNDTRSLSIKLTNNFDSDVFMYTSN